MFEIRTDLKIYKVRKEKVNATPYLALRSRKCQRNILSCFEGQLSKRIFFTGQNFSVLSCSGRQGILLSQFEGILLSLNDLLLRLQSKALLIW